MQAFWFELRAALRTLLGQPWFSALVVMVLAGGLACVLFMLAVINGLAWRPLPFPNAEQIQVVGLRDAGNPHSDADSMIDLEYLEAERRLGDLGRIAGYNTGTVNLSEERRAERYSGSFVTTGFFNVLGVPLQLGSGFRAEDSRPGAALKVVISDRLWQSRYLRDPQILGRAIRANGREAEIVGVTPAGFAFPQREDVWLPAVIDHQRAPGEAIYLNALLALKSADLRPELELRLQSWQVDRVAEQGEAASQRVVDYLPLADQVVDGVTRNVLKVLLAAVMLVLVVACANAANLLLSRTLARSNELSLKAALGASRRRLAMQLLAQSTVLVGVATLLALLLAHAGIGWFSALLQANEDAVPIWMRFDFDATMIGWTVLMALATALFTALVPALRAGRLSLADGLRQSGRGNSGGWFNRVARTLVVIEVGLSCALLILAGMMVRATSDMAQMDFGVDGSGLLTARLGLFASSHPTPSERLALFEGLSSRLEQTPGVESVALSTALPAMMAGYTTSRQGDRPAGVDERLPTVRYGAVDAGFVQTWRARLLQGRDFDRRDRTDSAPVAIIDRTYAERIFDGADPIGRSILLEAGGEAPRSFSVIGVVDTLQLEDPGDPVLPTVLVPLSQWDSRFVTVAVRTAGPPLDFSRTLVETMAAVDPDTPLYWLRDFDQVVRDAMFGERIISLLFTVFGVVALLLAGGGLYGVVAFSVAQRTRELGVRRALGAPSQRLLRNLLGRSGMEVGAGIVAGLLLGLALTRGMAAILNDFVSFHALTAGAIVLLLALVAAVAVLLPARRALAVDPMVALRSE